MKIDKEARYLKSHEWARKEEDEIIIGVSDYAQTTLSDVVYVELPEVGEEITKGEQYGVVESVKAAADMYAPMSGEVVAFNEELDEAPELVNEDPFGKGWMLRIKPSNMAEWDELLNHEAYQKVVEEEEGK